LYNCKIRCGYIGYRDIGDRGLTTKNFDIKPFTEDVDSVKQIIMKSVAEGGGDYPEDVLGALD